MDLDKTFKVGRSVVRLVMRTSDIDPLPHKYEIVRGSVVMDGMKTLGIDDIPTKGYPKNGYDKYLDVFRVEWDGRPVKIKKEDYGNIFNVSLKLASDSYSRPSSEGSVLIIPSVKGDAFLLSIMGGEGAGTFTAWWMIRKEGIVGFCAEGPP